MSCDIISEKELKLKICEWLIENKDEDLLAYYGSVENFARHYILPFNYRHSQSVSDEAGDLMTILRAEIVLESWETKRGKGKMKFSYCKMLKSFVSTPDVEPFPVGYIIVL